MYTNNQNTIYGVQLTTSEPSPFTNKVHRQQSGNVQSPNIFEQNGFKLTTSSSMYTNNQGTLNIARKKMAEVHDVLNENKNQKKSAAKKKSVPKSVRNAMYERDASNGSSKCYCCGTSLGLNTFHCGHIISRHNGGGDDLNNLRTICGGCNSSMGTKNLDDFKQQFFPTN